MKKFVNYRKRSVTLPKGCKDISDVLKMSGQSKGDSGSLPDAKCEYCGAPAIEGYECSIVSRGEAPSEAEAHYWCERCVRDLEEFRRRPENTLLKNINTEDEAVIRQFEEMSRREKAFMRRKVLERRGLC